MSHSIDYSTVEIPADKSAENYHYTERRAEILEMVLSAGSPARMRQEDLANRYGVDQSTISRDMDAIAEHVDEALGDRAKLATRAAFQRVLNDLLEEDDWRASKAAFDVMMDWNDWLADVGEQHREPRQAELDVQSRNMDVAYEIVDAAEGDLPTTDAGDPDYEELGFTRSPAEIDVETTPDENGNGDVTDE